MPIAPFTGAWIETIIVSAKKNTKAIAPFTGAWIETQSLIASTKTEASHPSRVRGLKLCYVDLLARAFAIAPFTGAWIETSP